MSREGMFRAVEGIFFRAFHPNYLETSLSGSRQAGRYSSETQPTLYLSSSPEGVEAAMIAHAGNRASKLQLIQVEVSAQRIFDLRDQGALAAAGVDPKQAAAPWQECVAEGRRPPLRGS